MPKAQKVTAFQEQVYTLLQLIPRGRVTTYGILAAHLHTSPRAVGNALRNNPFAPEVPCHRVIQSTGYIGGFLGECNAAPSGVNQRRKRELLKGEGVEFDEDGMIREVNGDGVEVWFHGPWEGSGKTKLRRKKEAEAAVIEVK